ncbi:MAG: prolipoprotein diacylglyceryl transferase [Oscillospiraceae bacterium]|nr:prolipoprotein diacylglyceryl transferase [Oscillospiraceae bacterium]
MREAVISFPMFGDNFSLDLPASLNAFLARLGLGPLPLDIYFYGLIIALGLLLAVFYVSRVCGRFHMTMDAVYDYLIWAVIAAVVGARLYYCVTYTDAEGVRSYLQDPVSFFRIRDGGLAIYGGVIGAAAALVFRARARKESVWKALDVMSLGLLIGQSVGRWGNFFNREAYGYETGIFCRMGLTLYGSTVYVHPTFLYESLWNALGFLLLHLHSKRYRRYQGQYFLLYLVWYGFGRMLIEGLRSDSLWLIPGSIRISQVLAALTFVLGGVLYLINRSRLQLGMKLLAGCLDADDPSPVPKAAPVPEAEASPEPSAPPAPAEEAAGEAPAETQPASPEDGEASQ